MLFRSILTKLATHVVVGRVLNVPPSGTPAGMFSVRVEESLISNVKEDIINVYGANNVLEMGKEYVFVLSKAAHTVYPFNFYVLFEEFILKVDKESNLVMRLENPVDRVFVEPFKNDKYNSLAELKKYIRSMGHKNVNQNSVYAVVEDTPNYDTLIDMADHILLIELTSVHQNSSNLVAVVHYKLMQAYKGGDLNNIFALVLPSGVETGQQYLTFLVNKADSVTLATRRGSLISEHDEDFGALVDQLKQR